MIQNPAINSRPRNLLGLVVNALIYNDNPVCNCFMLHTSCTPYNTVMHVLKTCTRNSTMACIQYRVRAQSQEKHCQQSRPTKAILDDNQTVQSASLAHEVGYDARKNTQGRKPFITVNTPAHSRSILIPPTVQRGRDGTKELPDLSLLQGEWLKRKFWVYSRCRNKDIVDKLQSPRKTMDVLAVGSGVAILSFRGTEPKQLAVGAADTRAFLVSKPAYFPSEIHSGFANTLASVHEELKKTVKALPGSGAVLNITGHSLGGALATMCAYRLDSERVYPIQGGFNYGSPPVGNAVFAQGYKTALGSRTFRVVNKEDLVTRVPPRASGYAHVGQVVYIDGTGTLQLGIGYWYRFLNSVANASTDFKKAAKTTVRDHSIALYCEHLKRVASFAE